MKGCMATGIFPQMRKEETAITAEIMSAVKEVDGMVIQKDVRERQKEIGKAVVAAGAVHAEAGVHDMRMMIMTGGGEVKEEDGLEIQKDIHKQQEEDGKAEAVVVVVMM